MGGPREVIIVQRRKLRPGKGKELRSKGRGAWGPAASLLVVGAPSFLHQFALSHQIGKIQRRLLPLEVKLTSED